MNTSSKPHVMVLMGGVSSEHDVSLRSGAKVAENLDPDQFDVSRVVIERSGAWQFSDLDDPVSFGDAVARLCTLHIDCVFPALHGPFGEDGRLQGLLDLLGLSYVGSGCTASGIAIDKIRSKALARSKGVRVARQRVIHRNQWSRDASALLASIQEELGFPCVMKSPCQGSSLGMAMPATREAFEQGINELLSISDHVLIEEYLKGTEVTCAVLDVEPTRPPRALPLTEIRPVSASFFDYEAKYTPGATEEITPARIPDDLTRTVQETAVRVHQIIGCTGLSRSDFIIVDETPVWLEVNTMPGLTETSLFPQAAAAAGIAFPDLMAQLVRRAMAGRRPITG